GTEFRGIALMPFGRFCLAPAMIGLLFQAVVSPAPAQTASAQPGQRAENAARRADPLLIDLDGYNQVVSKYHGKPLLVTFWATWCEPCPEEFPSLVELAKQYAGQGLVALGVSLDEDRDINLVRDFL